MLWRPLLRRCLVLILDVPVFRHRLLVMAALAQGLPIFCIPKELRITTVWFDMVDNRCRCQDTFLFAANAPRMPAEVPLPCLLPSPVVATFSSRPSVVLVEPCMFFTILLPVRHQPWTTGMRAGRLGFMRHGTISSSVWQAQLDLNQHPRFWKPSCFRYTMRLRP